MFCKGRRWEREHCVPCNKSLSSNVSQLYYNVFIPFCVYTTYFTLPSCLIGLKWLFNGVLINSINCFEKTSGGVGKGSVIQVSIILNTQFTI